MTHRGKLNCDSVLRRVFSEAEIQGQSDLRSSVNALSLVEGFGCGTSAPNEGFDLLRILNLSICCFSDPEHVICRLKIKLIRSKSIDLKPRKREQPSSGEVSNGLPVLDCHCHGGAQLKGSGGRSFRCRFPWRGVLWKWGRGRKVGRGSICNLMLKRRCPFHWMINLGSYIPSIAIRVFANYVS